MPSTLHGKDQVYSLVSASMGRSCLSSFISRHREDLICQTGRSDFGYALVAAYMAGVGKTRSFPRVQVLFTRQPPRWLSYLSGFTGRHNNYALVRGRIFRGGSMSKPNKARQFAPSGPDLQPGASRLLGRRCCRRYVSLSYS